VVLIIGISVPLGFADRGAASSINDKVSY